MALTQPQRGALYFVAYTGAFTLVALTEFVGGWTGVFIVGNVAFGYAIGRWIAVPLSLVVFVDFVVLEYSLEGMSPTEVGAYAAGIAAGLMSRPVENWTTSAG